MPNLLQSIPLLHVTSAQAAEAYDCGQLGFTKDRSYIPSSLAPDLANLGIQRDGTVLHLSTFSGDGVVGGVASFHVRDVDALYAEFAA